MKTKEFKSKTIFNQKRDFEKKIKTLLNEFYQENPGFEFSNIFVYNEIIKEARTGNVIVTCTEVTTNLKIAG